MGANLSKEEQLYQQVLKGNHDAVKALRRDGASLEWIDKEGRTPLIVACTRGELLDMAITLLKLGANMNVYKAGAHGGFPLHHAAKRGLDKTVTLLLSRGADPLALNDDGQTALDMARNRGHVSVVRLLEEKLSIFSESLRELSGFSLLESVVPQLVTKKVWVVVLQKEVRPRRAPLYELAIYESPRVSIWNGVHAPPGHPAGLCNVPQPRTLLPLTKAEVTEPDFGSSDPVLCIMDKTRKIKLKFRAENKGDKAQLDRFYQACKGVSEVQTEGPVSTTNLPASGAYSQGNPSQIHPIGALPLPVLQSVSVPLPLKVETSGVETATAIPEDVALALALDESIRTATEEGIPVSPTAFQCRDDDHEAWDSVPDGSKKWKNVLKEKTKKGRKGNKSVPHGRQAPFMDAGLSQLKECEKIAAQVGSAPPSAPPLPDSAACYPNLPVQANILSSGMVGTSMQNTAGRACVVCWDAPVEGACIPCGHLAGCMHCLTEIKSHRWGCPVCRCDIGQVIKVYAV